MSDYEEWREIVIDGYPVKKYSRKGYAKQGEGYQHGRAALKHFLIDKYKVCYFCGVETRFYLNVEGTHQPDDAGTIDHLIPRTHNQRRSHEIVEKVLACYKCNAERNNIAQREMTNCSSCGVKVRKVRYQRHLVKCKSNGVVNDGV